MSSSGAQFESKGLKDIFKAYNSFGGNPDSDNMDGRTFAKFAKEKGLLSTKCTATDIDLIFAGTKEKGSKKMNYKEFLRALEKVMQKDASHGTDFEAFVSKILSKGLGPHNSGTKADSVRLHDDKAAYTGVYKNGGPTNVDAGNGAYGDLSQLANRDHKVGVRGVPGS